MLELMRRVPPSSPLWTALIGLLSLGCCLVIYYSIPLGRGTLRWGAWSWIAFTVGLVALLALAALQIGRQVRAGHDPSIRVQSVVGLLAPLMVFFAAVYFAIESAQPGSFEGLKDRTDALYFTVVTLGTVGYGDIHPVSSLAQIMTMIQIVIDLVLVGVVISVTTTRARNRTRYRLAERNTTDDLSHPRGVAGSRHESELP